MPSFRTGSGRPLLLVHGLGNTEKAWTPILPMLSPKRELISVRLPGHGGIDERADVRPDLRPDVMETAAKRARMLAAEYFGIRIVVEEPELVAPGHEHRKLRLQQQGDYGS